MIAYALTPSSMSYDFGPGTTSNMVTILYVMSYFLFIFLFCLRISQQSYRHNISLNFTTYIPTSNLNI